MRAEPRMSTVPCWTATSAATSLLSLLPVYASTIFERRPRSASRSMPAAELGAVSMAQPVRPDPERT